MNVDDLKKKYEGQIRQQLSTTPVAMDSSKDYKEFRKSYIPKQQSLYEKACNLSEKIVKLKPDKKKAPVLERAIQ
jgi:hypothetical protein